MPEAPPPTPDRDDGKPGLLIADPSIDFLSALRKDPRARDPEPELVHEERATLRAIGRPGSRYAALFLNPKLCSPFSLPLIRQALKNHPATPLFLICDSEAPPLTQAELQGLAVRQALLKPLTFPDLLKACEDARLAFDPGEALKNASPDVVGQETEAQETDFVQLDAGSFLSGSSCFFDVYIKLGGAKYVKILQAGDAFSPDRVAHYVAKGLKSFYIRKGAQESYLKYCDQLTGALLRKDAVPSSVKIAVTAHQAEQVVQFLKTHGVDGQAILHANRFVENVHTLSQQLKRQRIDEINRFLESMDKVAHGVALTTLVSFLAKPLHFEAERSVHLLGLTGLLHDIGLQDMDPKFAAENERGWSVDEVIAYRTHPDKGAAILARLEQVDPTVVQAVRQHHERRSRTGFPQRIGAGAINQVAEIVGICDEFMRIIHGEGQGDGATGHAPADLKAILQDSLYREFSAPVVHAFAQAFRL